MKWQQKAPGFLPGAYLETTLSKGANVLQYKRATGGSRTLDRSITNRVQGNPQTRARQEYRGSGRGKLALVEVRSGPNKRRKFQGFSQGSNQAVLLPQTAVLCGGGNSAA